MKNFVLVNIRDEIKLKKYQENRSVNQIDILPYYGEGYACFSSRKEHSFEELIRMFLKGDEDEQIGAISVISKKYPTDLYKYLSDNLDSLPSRSIKFLLYRVVNSYLPLVIPEDDLLGYDFGDNCSNDIWVNIFLLIRADLIKRNAVEIGQ